MDSDIMPETAEHEPYPLQFGHVEGGEYELRSEELGPGRVERAGSLGQQLEEQYEEEQAIAGSPPKMLPPPFPMDPTGASLKNNPPTGNEQQAQQAAQEPVAGKAAPPMAQAQAQGTTVVSE